MKKVNQKGFSVVEILLILTVIGLLTGGGWYIISKNKDSQKDKNTSQTQAAPSPGHTDDKESSDKLKTYSDDSGLSFTYPKDWIVSATDPFTGENAGNKYMIVSDIDASGWFSGNRKNLAGHQGVFIYVFKGNTGPSFGSRTLSNDQSIAGVIKVNNTNYKQVTEKYQSNTTKISIESCDSESICNDEISRSDGKILIWISALNNVQAGTEKIETSGELFDRQKAIIESIKF